MAMLSRYVHVAQVAWVPILPKTPKAWEAKHLGPSLVIQALSGWHEVAWASAE